MPVIEPEKLPITFCWMLPPLTSVTLDTLAHEPPTLLKQVEAVTGTLPVSWLASEVDGEEPFYPYGYGLAC
jgi:hypothetical protein